MSGLELLLFIVIPYAAITSFVLGHVWRYRRDQYTVTSRSTQLLERRWLRPGILLFHVGMLAVLGGHVIGILVPAALTEAVGVSDHMYHAVSVTAGTIAGGMMLAGFLILLIRRLVMPRVRATTSTMDWITFALLGTVIALGMYATVGRNLLGGGYDYRDTVAPWFRGLFTLDPDVAGVASAPLVYRMHAVAAFLLLGLWPYTRLVHAWSVPVMYLNRRYLVYRARGPVASTPAVPSPGRRAVR